MTPSGRRWDDILTRLGSAGRRDGANAADWWAQDTVGGRATGNPTTIACAVLAGIDDGDPLILDTLPTLRAPDPDEAAEIYSEASGDHAPPWDPLSHARRLEAITAYRDAYDQAAADRAAWHCRNTTEATDRPAA